MNGFLKCSVVLAIIALGLLLLVNLIEVNTSRKILSSQRRHKHALVNNLLNNLNYDTLLNLQLDSEDAPIILNSSVSLSSVDAIITDKQRIAVLIELATSSGYNGTIKLLVAIRANGTVLGLRVIDHRETPGLGDKIELSRSNWIHSFNNQSLKTVQSDDWNVKRDGGEFDQFTGATITPRSIVKAIHQTLVYVRDNRQALFNNQTTHTLELSQ